ncbi:MAG: hypothetical protein Q9161_000683 [Pseudevernia consocians]
MTSNSANAQVPPSYAEEYSGDIVLRTAIAFIVLELTFVTLRYISRALGKLPAGPDDYLMIPALVICLGVDASSIVSLYVGNVGYHMTVVAEKDPASLVRWAKVLIVTPAIYPVACALPKLAIIAIYLRIFPQKSFRIACYTVGATIIAVAIADVVAGITLCTPLRYLWDKSIVGGHCININAFYRYGPMPNIFTDLAMLLLPLPLIWRLHTSRSVKVGVTLTFLTGSIGLVTSIIRCVEFFLHNALEDGTWNSVTFLVWSVVEPGVYLIAACLPCYRHLYNYIKTGDAQSSTGSRFSRSGKRALQAEKRSAKFIKLESRISNTTAKSGYPRRDIDEEILIGPGSNSNVISEAGRRGSLIGQGV